MSEETRGNPETSAEPGEEPKPEAQTDSSAAQAEAAKLKDMLVRTAADFDNYRKRTRREVDDARRAGREDLLKATARLRQPRARHPERAKGDRSEGRVRRAFDDCQAVRGHARARRDYASTDDRHDVRPCPPRAIQQVETNEQAPGTIVAEVQPGYVAGDKLVRAAMVVVAKPRSDGVDPAGPA